MDLQLTAKTVNQQRDRRLPPGRWSRLRRAGAPLRPSRTMVRLGYAIAAWGGVFAAVHFYRAAGGTALNNGGPVDGGAAAYIAFIAVLGGLVGLAIARAATRRIPRRPLLLLTRVGATLLLFGVAIAAIRLAAGTDDSWTEHPMSTAAITLYFLAGGVLYALAARAVQRADTIAARRPRQARASGRSPTSARYWVAEMSSGVVAASPLQLFGAVLLAELVFSSPRL